MAYLALYRKYRPSSLNELVGQVEIADIIRNAILNNKISHAYLFSGPRGTGKTSTAKIIAKMVNCEHLTDDGNPCGSCNSCVNFNFNSDIVEIDAASNNGVDEIRELRDKVNLVPTTGKYKVYIIDEVHMLTTQAFNALLKTLEEPPSHVIFILATTEFHKIPATVISRCQKFQFIKFSTNDIVSRLNEIAKKENIDISLDVLNEIARLSDGGLRDAINLLDQVSSFRQGNIILDDLYKISGVISYNEFYSLVNSILHQDISYIITFIDEIDKNGKSFERFIVDFISFLKDILIFLSVPNYSFENVYKSDVIEKLSKNVKLATVYKFIFELNELSLNLKNSSYGKILIITKFIELSLNFSNLDNHDVLEEKLHDSVLKSEFNSTKDKIEVQSLTTNHFIMSDKDRKIRINNAFATASKSEKEHVISKWAVLLEKANNDSSYLSISGMVNDIEILVVGDRNIIFLAQYDSLLERLFENLLSIEKILEDIYHKSYKVVFLLKDEWIFEKNKYIENVKKGIKYSVIEEDMKLDQLKNDNINKLVSILGEDVVVYE